MITQSELHREMPQSPDAEKGVLCSILHAPVEILALCSEHGVAKGTFYVPAHGEIFEACGEIISANRKLDFITLAQWLKDRNKLDQVGGAPMLNDLFTFLGTAANAGFYIETLLEKHMLRQIIMFGNEAATRGYEEQAEPVKLLAEIEERALKLRPGTERTQATMKETVVQCINDIEKLYENRGAVLGLATGFSRLDKMTGGFLPGQMITIAARPSVGKTAYSMNLVEHWATVLKKTVGVFSLEMSMKELIMRNLCSIARVNIARIRDGFMSEREFPALTAASTLLSQAKILIDDQSGLSIQELRQRARRWRQRHNIEAIVIDYLQLMNSSSKKAGNSRNVEVAEISGGIKAMAKELQIPVVVLAQLNRKPDERQDGRPKLSDLREDGCLSCATTNLFVDGGVQTNDSSRMNTYSLNSAGGVVVRPSKNIPRPVRKMIRVVLGSGRFVDCTPNHPILTDRGFVRADKLTREHSVASVCKIAEPRGTMPIPEAKWIGWMLGNGSMTGYSSPSFITSCPVVAAEFCRQTKALFGLEPKPHRHWCVNVHQFDITAGPVRTAGGNPCKNWLRQHEMWGARAAEKQIPAWFLGQADNKSIAELLSGLFETDGSATRNSVKFSTTSNRMAWQVVWCLARLGIFCYIDNGYQGPHGNHPVFDVRVACGIEVRKFRELIPMTGTKADKLRSFRLSETGTNHGNRLGVWVQEEIIRAQERDGVTSAQLGYRTQGKRISQRDLAKLLPRLPSLKHLSHLVNPNIYWDRLDALHQIEDGEVFDREVTNGPHNFVANGIIVHNSIEQDSDFVGFLTREDYQCANDEERMQKMGRAALIIAKQRNGPTGEVPLTFIREFTRFEDRAEEYAPE